MPVAAQNPISRLGASFSKILENLGHFSAFAANGVLASAAELSWFRGWLALLPHCFTIGALSVPVVALTGAFVGMVLVVQGWAQFDAAGLADRLGAIVNVSVASELGPVLAGVMLAGRVGGALTAELGTMNVTEQLLALRAMGVDPVRYLVAPRFLACLLLTPLLTLYADLMGALGAWAVYAGMFGGESGPYWQHTADVVMYWDLGVGIVKAFFFGGAIGLLSCYMGFHCRAGAEGVGRACTQAFVASFIIILIMDFFLGVIINRLFELWYGYRTLI